MLSVRFLASASLACFLTLSARGATPGDAVPAGAAPPAASSTKGALAPVASRVLVLWIGADGGASVTPPVHSELLARTYVNQGFRVLKADALEPEGLFLMVQRDRRANPQDYRGAIIHFVVHGKGAVEGRLSTENRPRVALLGQVTKPVKDQELVSALLAGIGPEARAEIIGSVCFSGAPCEEIPLEGTPYEGLVTRILVGSENAPKNADPAQPDPFKAKVLSELLTVLVDNIPAVGTTREQRQLAAPMLASPAAVFEKPNLLSPEQAAKTPSHRERVMEKLRQSVLREAKRAVQSLATYLDASVVK